MTLCPFETLAHGSSPFCELFGDDLKYSDYWGDVDKYYYTGYKILIPTIYVRLTQ
jgi:hypothetical protein